MAAIYANVRQGETLPERDRSPIVNAIGGQFPEQNQAQATTEQKPQLTVVGAKARNHKPETLLQANQHQNRSPL